MGRLPPVEAMVDAGVHVAIGTDNAMLHPANVLAEAAFLRRVLPDLPPAVLLRALLDHGRALVPDAPADPLAPGSGWGVVVLDPRGEDPAEALWRSPKVVYRSFTR